MAAIRPETRTNRRPRASASRANGKADNAAESVNTVVIDPAHASDPDRSTARSDPMDNVAPLPIPLRSWAELSRKTVRR